MISVWVGLFRNFFCVCKSIAPQEHIFHRKLLNGISGQIRHTTVVELLISSLQLCAVFFNVWNGFSNIVKGYFQSTRVSAMGKLTLSKIDSKSIDGEANKQAFLILCEDIDNALNASYLKILIGIGEVVIGISFIFLCMNSLHLHGPTHPKPLIDALTCMEVAFIFFLVVMWRSLLSSIQDSVRAAALATALEQEVSHCYDSPKAIHELIMNCGYSQDSVEAIHVMYPPSNYSWIEVTDPLRFDTLIDSNLRSISTALTILSKKGENEKEVLQATIHRMTATNNLRRKALEAFAQSPLDAIYFILNFIAFYGYLIGILCYYFPEDTQGQGSTPRWVHQMKFGLSNDVADWWGNLIGDIAWTLEPAIILTSKYLMTHACKRLYPSPEKVPPSDERKDSKKNR